MGDFVNKFMYTTASILNTLETEEVEARRISQTKLVSMKVNDDIVGYLKDENFTLRVSNSQSV